MSNKKGRKTYTVNRTLEEPNYIIECYDDAVKIWKPARWGRCEYVLLRAASKRAQELINSMPETQFRVADPKGKPVWEPVAQARLF